jgi:dATP pyrophosphohydrolase
LIESTQGDRAISSETKLKVQVWIYRENPRGTLEVLLLRLKPARGGYWQPVTGGVERDEDLKTAALREAREETGLAFVKKPEPLDFKFRYYSDRHESDCEEHVFALQAPAGSASDELKLDPHEHVESQWLRAKAASCELKHPSNRDGLERLIAKHSEGL